MGKTVGDQPVNTTWASDGLTKREYFAAMALSGLATVFNTDSERAAHNSVNYADALIKALNETN